MGVDDPPRDRGRTELAKFLKLLAEAERAGVLPRRGRRESDSFAFSYRLLQEFIDSGLGGDGNRRKPSPPRMQPQPDEPREEDRERALREPVTDLFDEAEELVLVYELPGAARKNIRTSLDGDTLRLEAETPEWVYRKSVVIEARLAARPPRLRLRNGVLELRLRKEP